MTKFRQRVKDDIAWYKEERRRKGRPLPEEIPPPTELSFYSRAVNTIFRDRTPNRLEILYKLQQQIAKDDRNNEQFDDELFDLYNKCFSTLDYGLWEDGSDLAKRMRETLQLQKTKGVLPLNLRKFQASAPLVTEGLTKYQIFTMAFVREILAQYSIAWSKKSTIEVYKPYIEKAVNDAVIKKTATLIPAVPVEYSSGAGIFVKNLLLGSNPDSEWIDKLANLADTSEELEFMLKNIISRVLIGWKRDFIEQLPVEDIIAFAEGCAGDTIIDYLKDKSANTKILLEAQLTKFLYANLTKLKKEYAPTKKEDSARRKPKRQAANVPPSDSEDDKSEEGNIPAAAASSSKKPRYVSDSGRERVATLVPHPVFKPASRSPLSLEDILRRARILPVQSNEKQLAEIIFSNIDFIRQFQKILFDLNIRNTETPNEPRRIEMRFIQDETTNYSIVLQAAEFNSLMKDQNAYTQLVQETQLVAPLSPASMKK